MRAAIRIGCIHEAIAVIVLTVSAIAHALTLYPTGMDVGICIVAVFPGGPSVSIFVLIFIESKIPSSTIRPPWPGIPINITIDTYRCTGINTGRVRSEVVIIYSEKEWIRIDVPFSWPSPLDVRKGNFR